MTTDAAPRPVRRARVELSDTAGSGGGPKVAFTDERGAFAFSNLPAGRFTLAATKPSFVRAAYGAKAPDRPGTPITIAQGQRLTDVVLKLAPGAVITGTVRDELGQPVQGVNMRVMRYRALNGDRVLAPVAIDSMPLGASTDDRGIYRLYGLPAGDYYVMASPTPPAEGDVRKTTAADLRSATPRPTTVVYAPVFYPGTTSEAVAEPVTVRAGEERTGIDLSLQLVRTAHIEGVVTAPPGVPPSAVNLMMIPADRSTGMMLRLNRATPDADGTFSFDGVPPGQYTDQRAIRRAKPDPVDESGAGHSTNERPAQRRADAPALGRGQRRGRRRRCDGRERSHAAWTDGRGAVGLQRHQRHAGPRHRADATYARPRRRQERRHRQHRLSDRAYRLKRRVHDRRRHAWPVHVPRAAAEPRLDARLRDRRRQGHVGLPVRRQPRRPRQRRGADAHRRDSRRLGRVGGRLRPPRARLHRRRLSGGQDLLVRGTSNQDDQAGDRRPVHVQCSAARRLPDCRARQHRARRVR